MRLIFKVVCTIIFIFSFTLISACSLINNSIATVGKYEITQSEFKYFLRGTKFEMESAAKITQKSASDIDVKNYKAAKKKYWTKSKLNELRKKALKEVQEYKVKLAKAKEAKINLTANEKQQIVSSIESSLIQQNGTIEKAKRRVKEDFNVTLEEFEDIYTNYQIINKFLEGEKAKIKIDDAAIQKEYQKKPASYNAVTVRHILLTTVNLQTQVKLSEDEINKKKEKADELLQQAKDGADFAELAKENTEDTASKESGGEITFSKGDNMVKEFTDWSFKAKEGDLGIIETQYGYHVMKFEKKITIEDEKIKGLVESTLQAAKLTKLVDEWIKDKNYKMVKNTKMINSIDIGKI